MVSREGELEQTEWIREAAERKLNKYNHLLQRWRKMGWNTDATLRIIAVGIRGGIPNITHTDLTHLGIEPARATRVCRTMSLQTGTRLGYSLNMSRALKCSQEHRNGSAIAMTVWKDTPRTHTSTTDRKGKKPMPLDTG